jgi:hypothetical protein
MQPTTHLTEPITARIRGSAVAALEAYAARDGVTRSEWIAKAVYQELHRRNQANDPAPNDD